jgi:hypothetical protein
VDAVLANGGLSPRSNGSAWISTSTSSAASAANSSWYTSAHAGRRVSSMTRERPSVLVTSIRWSIRSSTIST